MEGESFLERGARVGDYTIEGLLGEGGFGAVYRATSDAGITAALKVFKTAGELTAERLISQQNEIEALLKLHHPSLVTLYGYGSAPGIGMYLAMELVEGETLDAYLDRVGVLETLEAVRLVRKVAEALAHCHAQGVLHLDLKPSNILIADPLEPRVKVLDFGLATLTHEWLPDDARVTAGTVGYMAPECLRSGRARPDPRMDLYALGTILYELVSGRLPFRGRGQRTIMLQRTAGEMVPLREAAPRTLPAVCALVDELLAQDPAARPRSATQLCARLKEIYYDTLRGGESDSDLGPQSTRAPTSVRPMSLAAPRTTSLPPRQTDEVPFVGREGELSRLASRVLGATNRAGAPIVIFGDAGMGKSRLVSELLNVVEQDGAAVVIYARCRELSALVPYSPLREALSRLATVTKKKDERTARVQAATNLAIEADPELASALVPELGLGQTDAETRRSLLRPGGAKRVATLIHRIVKAIAAELPVLVAIEDLHWGDESTLAALEALSGLIEDARVLLLGTTRPPSRVTWRDAEMMELRPLDRGENERLLAELTRGSDDEFLRTLQTRVPLLGAGNPLFNIQVIRNLEVDGFVGRTPFGTLALSSRNPADYRAPASIEEALRRGVDSLSTESLEVLGVAALLGRQFLRSDLRALGLFEPQRIERALEEAERRCLCLSEPSQTSFVHEVVLEQLERRTVRKDHREHHKRIAKALERRGADPGTLARHLERAGMTMRAANALVESALAARSADPIGASQKLRHAIDLVDPEPPSAERNDLLIAATAELCRARSLLGGTEELLTLLERCTAHTPAASAELYTSYALVRFARGELDLARAAAEQAISAAGNDPTLDRHRSTAMNVLGRVRASAGRLQDALAALGGGCRVAERAGEWLELCHARALYGATLGEAGDPEGAEREIQAAADLAERLSDPARFLGVWLACAIFAEARCDLDLGVGSTAQLLAYAEEHKLGGHYHYLGTLYAGRHQFHAGHVHRARLLLTNALNLARIVGTSLGQALAHAFLGDVHLVEGHLQEALAAYDQALELGAGPDGDERAYCLAIVGRMHATALAQGHPGEVRRLGEDAIARISSSGHRALLVPALERFAEALEEVGSLAAVAAVRAHYEVISSSLDAPGATFWPRIPDADIRATGMEPRLYWRTRNDKPRASSEWFLPTEPVSPSALLTTRAAKIRTVETTARAYTSRSAIAAIPRTATRTGLLDSLSTMEGFLPNFEAVLDAMFEKNGA